MTDPKVKIQGDKGTYYLNRHTGQIYYLFNGCKIALPLPYGEQDPNGWHPLGAALGLSREEMFGKTLEEMKTLAREKMAG